MRSSRFAKSGLGIPYALFLLLFVVAPLFVLLYYAFTNGQGQFTVQNLAAFFTSPNTIGTLAYSFALAVVTTCVCVLLAYPIAYILARSNMRHKSVILVAFVMPMWINFSLRITALKEILTFIEGNLAYHPFLNTVIGMTYDFLPFMILPLYTTLSKVTITEDGTVKLSFVPCIQQNLTTRILTEPEERSDFYEYLASISADIGIDVDGVVYHKSADDYPAGEILYDSDTSRTDIIGIADNEGDAIDIVGNLKEDR